MMCRALGVAGDWSLHRGSLGFAKEGMLMSGRGYRSFCWLVASLFVVGNVGCGGQDAKEPLPKASLTAQAASADSAEESAGESSALAVQLQADEANPNSPAAEPENLYPEVLISTSL